MSGRPVIVKRSRRDDSLSFWGIYRLGIGCCGFLTLVGVLLLTVVFWPKVMNEFDKVQKCTDSVEVCVRSESCGDPTNQCTVGKLCAPCDDPDTADCEIRNRPNGVACEDACYLTGTASCSTGECKGTCAGYCNVNSTCDPKLILLSPETAAWVNSSETDTAVFWICSNGVCTYNVGPINRDGILELHDALTTKMDDDYLTDFCLSLLERSQRNLKCIDASIFRLFPAGNIVSGEYTQPEYYTLYFCTYQYSCAKQTLVDPPLPLSPRPTGPVSAKRQEGDALEKRGIPVSSTSKAGSGFGSSGLPTFTPPKV